MQSENNVKHAEEIELSDKKTLTTGYTKPSAQATTEPLPPPSSRPQSPTTRPCSVTSEKSNPEISVDHHDADHRPTKPEEHDLEAGPDLDPKPIIDIEHVPVDNDPRQWPSKKKTGVLVMIAFAALSPTLGASIYNPAFDELRQELNATDTELSLSVSLFILFQGGFPICELNSSPEPRGENSALTLCLFHGTHRASVWSSIAEVIGRKLIYLVSIALFITGTIVASRANSMTLLIIMRLLQGFGSSAVLAIGAGSLADMYEVHERGSKMGVYYAVPLIGPALGS